MKPHVFTAILLIITSIAFGQNKRQDYFQGYTKDVNSNPATFQLSVNAKQWFSFSNSGTSELGIRKFQGKDGAELKLNVTMLDKYEDQMGFAVLKLPVNAIMLGEPAHIKLSTKTINNVAWFMTYRTQIEEKITIYQNKVVAKKDGKLFHSVSIDFIHLGDDAKASIKIGNIKKSATLKAGFNKLEIYLPKARPCESFPPPNP